MASGDDSSSTHSCLPPLEPDLAKKAEEELNEVPAERLEQIRTFREAVLSVPGLKARTDDAFLLRFLRVRKFDQDRALDMIKSYYKQRTKYPDLYKTMLTTGIPKCLESNIIGVLPNRDAEGRPIVVFRCGTNWDPSIVTWEDIIRSTLLALELLIQVDAAQVNGVVFIVNLEGYGLKQFSSISPSKLYQFFSVTQNGFPARFKKIHYINDPTIFGVVFAMFRPFLKQKFKDRIHFHGSNLSALHEFISPEILPEDFGGTWSEEDNSKWDSEWKRRLIENDAVIIRDQELGF